MLLKDQPTLKDVAKVFIVGLALRSYLADANGKKRRTCLGHEMSRLICMAVDRSRLLRQRRRQLKFMTLERIKDYDMWHKKQRELTRQAHNCVANSSLNSSLSS